MITLIGMSLNTVAVIPKVNAASFRTKYKIYGDLNGDNMIDVFDVISMRNKVAKGSDDKSLDFNCDGTIDSKDINLLNDYVLGKNTIFDAYLYDDADDDSVCDMLEIALLQSDPDSKDTDGDTLTDFEEIVYSNTSPTNKFTRGISIIDADDDADGDKLTNKEEIVANTNPQIDDSDFDGINDYDELKNYNTDPNNEDSDSDGIIDGDEIQLGLKPDFEKSDGKTFDYQRTFGNKILSSNKLFSYVNTEDAPYEISIDIKAAGNVEKALSIQSGSFANTSEDDHFIGKSIKFSYDEKFTVDTARIYFKPKSIDGSIEDYMIFEYFPDTNYLLPVETNYTSDSAYVETSEFGTFTLVNINDKKQLSVSRNNLPANKYNALASESTIGSEDIVYDYNLDDIEVVFFVDTSNTLTEKLEVTKKSIIDCSQAIFEHSDNSYVEIIGYYTSPDISSKKLSVYADSYDAKLLNNINSVEEALNNLKPVTNSTNNSMNNVIWDIDTLKEDIFSSNCKNKYAFIISNSSYSFTTNMGYGRGITSSVCESLEAIYNSDVHLNFLLAKEIFLNYSAISNFKEACAPYNFGVYNNLETGYFGNTGFARIYSDAIMDINKTSVYHITSLTPQSIPTEVNRNAFLNSLPSSYDKSKVPAADSNGNINFKETAVKIGAAYYDENGNLVFPSMLEACSLNELTRLGYEQYMKNKSASDRLLDGDLRITPFSDKILYKDTDGDGIPNKDDPYPNKKFDERFEIVDDYGHFPIMDFMIESKLGTGSTKFDPQYGIPGKDGRDLCFNIREPELADRYHYTFQMECASFAQLPITDSLAGVVAGKGWVPMNRSGIYLLAFLLRENMIGIYPESVGEIITTDHNNLFHYMINVNAMIELCEETLPENKTMIFSSNHEDNFKIACYADKHGKCPNHYFEVDKSDAITTKEGDDWSFAIGDSFCGLVCSAVRSGSTYTMNYKIYLMDYYEWGYHVDGGDKEQHMLHECGLAREYPIYGVIENTITWEHGYRIKSPKEVKKLVATSKKSTSKQIKEEMAKLDKAVKTA